MRCIKRWLSYLLKKIHNIYKKLKHLFLNLVERLIGILEVDVGIVFTNTRVSFGGLLLLKGITTIPGVTHSFSLPLPSLHEPLHFISQSTCLFKASQSSVANV